MSPFPTADDIALAICLASIEWSEDPVECARGVPEMTCRRAAFCALEIVFPEVNKHALARMVGYDREGRRYARDFNGRSRTEKAQRYRVQWQIAAEISAQVQERSPDAEIPAIALGNTKRITLRRPPDDGGQDVTASLMGDPPPQRSALADKRFHEDASQ